MSDPKYIYGEIDANEWHLYELRDDHPTQPGYHLIATIECEEEVIERITAALNSRTCTWTKDADGYWFTECGNAFEFMEDGPEENNRKFCPYCGGQIKEIAREALMPETATRSRSTALCEIPDCGRPVEWQPQQEGTARLCEGHWAEFDAAMDGDDPAAAMRLFAQVQQTRL